MRVDRLRKIGGSATGVPDIVGDRVARRVDIAQMSWPRPIQIALSHPTGNRNVRAALAALQTQNMLHSYWTGFAWNDASVWSGVIPSRLRRELARRRFAGIPYDIIVQRPVREVLRLTVQRLLGGFDAVANLPLLRADTLNSAHDNFVARSLRPDAGYDAVYAPIGASHRTLDRARQMGLKTVLEITSPYYRFYRDIINEEAERVPHWASTLEDAVKASGRPRTDDAELETADLLIAPSRFVVESLRDARVSRKRKPLVISYGCPGVGKFSIARRSRREKLKVLFVGSLTQAKGLSYLFDAVSRASAIVDTTIVGRLRTRECRALNDALMKVTWYPHLPQEDVLRLMEQCDVLVLPSLAEGMGLVVGEAMSRGRPVIVTPNCRNDGLVEEGITGSIVPIRDAVAIEQALVLLAQDHDRQIWMSENAYAKAISCSDVHYGESLCGTLKSALNER